MLHVWSEDYRNSVPSINVVTLLSLFLKKEWKILHTKLNLNNRNNTTNKDQMNRNHKVSNCSPWNHKSWMIQQTLSYHRAIKHPLSCRWWLKTYQPLNPFRTTLRYYLHESQLWRTGISGCRGTAVRLWWLSETYPILFLTGRAELMFHFTKHPLPLSPQPDVWHHPGLFHADGHVDWLTVAGPE